MPKPRVLLGGALVALFLGAGAGRADPIAYWDMSDPQAPGQVTLFNPDVDDAANGVPLYALDWNGDGRDEIVISAFNGDGPRGGPARAGAGEIHVTFWSGPLRGTVNFQVPDRRVLQIVGAAPGDYFGNELTSGDLDGDGWLDLVVGSFGASAPGRVHAGKVYVFFGGPTRRGGSVIDLAQGLPNDVTCILGSDVDGRLGVWSEVGDVNGDGHDDLVMGSDRADAPGPGRAESGKIVVIPGPLPRGVVLDLSIYPKPLLVVWGVDAGDHFGASTSCADLDGDGYAEVMGAAASHGLSRNTYDSGGSGDGPPGLFRLDAGEVWIVWGAPVLPDTIDLKSPPPGVTLTAIYGREREIRCGEELYTADVNGDGLPDLLVGALTANGPPDDYRRNAGEGYVFYGGPGLRGQALDMAVSNYPHVRIYGTEESIAGDSFVAGDVNGDGYQDLLVGLPHDFGPTHRHGGTAIVVYGGPALPAVIDLAAPTVPVTVLDGADPHDDTAYFLASGDIDGDGYDETIVNAMSGKGWRNHGFEVGDARVVSGAWLTLHPDAPGGLEARGCPEGECVDLTWNPSPTPGTSAYRVRWGLASDALAHGQDVQGTGARIRGLPARERCYFQVTALMDGLESRPVSTAWATPFSPPRPVLVAEPLDAHRVRLSWSSCPSPDLLGYAVYRRASPGAFTKDDILSPGLLTDTTWVDSTAVPYAANLYQVTPFLENLFEGDPSNRCDVFPHPSEAGRGILLVNDYLWANTSDGPYSNVAGDPYEMYAARTLTGSFPFTFWDARPDAGWWAYPPEHEPVGHGPLDGDVLFDHGVLVWAGFGPDGPYDDRFENEARLLRAFHDAGGAIVLASWQMGSYLPYELYDLFGVADFGRPNAVLANRLLLPQVPELSVIGPGPGVSSAPICDVLEPDPALRHRVLYRLDFYGSPPLGMIAMDANGFERTLLLSVPASFLDPATLGTDMSALLSRFPRAFADPTGVPETPSPALVAGPAYPNPGRGSVYVDFRLAVPGRVAVDAFDLRGRRIARVAHGAFAEGPHTVSWDGRDDAGRPVAAGVYFLRLAGDAMNASRRVVLLD